MIGALRQFIGKNQMMAYLVMMAARLVELHRVLKPTGSLYLHCDPTASHYLKIVLDTIFGPQNFRNEITWKRRTGSSSAVHQSNKLEYAPTACFSTPRPAPLPSMRSTTWTLRDIRSTSTSSSSMWTKTEDAIESLICPIPLPVRT